MSETVAPHPIEVGLGGGSHGGATPALHVPEVYRVLMRRAGALLVDAVIWGIPILGLALSVGRSTEPVIVETANGLVLSEQMTIHLSLLQIWSVTALWFVYLAVSEWRFGATLGKKAVGVGVLRSDGTRVGAKAAVVRQAPRFAIISLLMLFSLYPLVPVVFLAEALIARADDRRQRIGDRLADTVVVRADHVRMLSGQQSVERGWMPMDAVRPPVPEQVRAAGYRAYAGFWQRFGAVLVDSIIVLLITIPWSFVSLTESLVRLPGREASGWMSTAGPVLDELVLVLVGFGYFAWLNGRGATLGKMLFGLRVIDATGRAPGLGKGAVRQIIPGASALVPYVLAVSLRMGFGAGGGEGQAVATLVALVVVFAYFLFGFYDGLSMLWNDRRQTIHDRMAGTFVVRGDGST
jgi:uncharacterized RDD family membrane protein YckC